VGPMVNTSGTDSSGIEDRGGTADGAPGTTGGPGTGHNGDEETQFQEAVR